MEYKAFILYKLLEISSLISEMNTLLSILENCNKNTSVQHIESVTKQVEIIYKNRNALIQKYPLVDLKKFNDQFEVLIKQILENLDNIIEVVKLERLNVGLELKNSLNQKRITSIR